MRPAGIGPADAEAQGPRPVLSFLNVERDQTLFARQNAPVSVFCPGAYQFVSFSFSPIGQQLFVQPIEVRSIVPLPGGNGVTIDFANPGPLGPITVRAVAFCVLLGQVAGAVASDDDLDRVEAAGRKRRKVARRPRVRTRAVRQRVRVRASRRPRRRSVTAVCENANSAPVSFGYRSRRSEFVGARRVRHKGRRGFRATFRTTRRDTLNFYAICIHGSGPVRVLAAARRGAPAPAARPAQGGQVRLSVSLMTGRTSAPERLGGLDIYRFRAGSSRGQLQAAQAGGRLIGGMPPLPDRNFDRLVATGFQELAGGNLQAVAAMRPGEPVAAGAGGADVSLTWTVVAVSGADVDGEVEENMRRFVDSLPPGPGVPGPLPPPPAPDGGGGPGGGGACADGIDNDGDGKTDHPNDPGCENAGDDSEVASRQQSLDIVCPDNVDDASRQLNFLFYIPEAAQDVQFEFLSPGAPPTCPGTGDTRSLLDPFEPQPPFPEPGPGQRVVNVRNQITPNPAGNDTSFDGVPVTVTVRLTYT